MTAVQRVRFQALPFRIFFGLPLLAATPVPVAVTRILSGIRSSVFNFCRSETLKIISGIRENVGYLA